MEELSDTLDNTLDKANIAWIEYGRKKLEVLNIVAPKIVALSKMKKTQQVIAVMKGTGSEYITNKWIGDPRFANRYLNSDSKNQPLWCKMMGIKNPTDEDCYALHQAMLFFNNHSLTHCFKEDSLKRMRLNVFGNGENWCKLWLKLSNENKNHLIEFF